MRVLLQRVTKASVTVNGETVSSIGKGLLLLVGIGAGDTEEDAQFLADKIAQLRIFEDSQERMNLSALEVSCEVLAVSQFTLYADVRRGRRPSFTEAAQPEEARILFERFVDMLKTAGLKVETGRFREHMHVEVHNDGPVTIMMDSKELMAVAGTASMKHTNSQSIFKRSQKVMPGGVNSPVRSFSAVGGGPIVVAKGEGSHIWDVDGNEYIDYVGSWGPLILGHAAPSVVNAVSKAARDGLSYGAPTRQEMEMAELITKAMPSMEMARMVSSGTEAVMSAIRAARAYTGRDKIVKFEGCYHGHSDGMLVKAGSGVMTFGVADSAGIPEGYARNTLTAQYNDLTTVEALFKANRGQIAAIIVEPVAANMGVVLPQKGFLEGLRKIASREKALLIFDEVITGFRLAYGGAQSVYKVTPDLTCLGKIIGGGMPVGAYGGRRDVMGVISPLGPAYQAGTLSGNPVAMAAGIATLKELTPAMYRRIDSLAAGLESGLANAAKTARISEKLNRAGSMLTLFFTSRSVVDYESARKSDLSAFSRYFKRMLEEGVYLPPSQFEAMFVSASHTQQDIKRTIKAAKAAFEASE